MITRSLPLRNRLLRRLFRLAAGLLFQVHVTGQENVPRDGVLVVSNHISWIDHLLLFAVLPTEPRLYLLGAGQSINSPFKSWLFRTFGSIIAFERGADWVGKAPCGCRSARRHSSYDAGCSMHGDSGINKFLS